MKALFEGTFTHSGDRCTFEVLLDTFGLKDLVRIAFGGSILDALLELYRRKLGAPEQP